WADFVFKQVGEEGRSARGNQANAERADTGGAAEVSGVAAAPLAVAQTPALEEERDSADADSPPAHWLARVQKDAPDLLKQKGGSGRNIVAPSHTMSSAQANGSTQTADTQARAQATATNSVREEKHPIQERQPGEEEAEAGRAGW